MLDVATFNVKAATLIVDAASKRKKMLRQQDAPLYPPVHVPTHLVEVDYTPGLSRQSGLVFLDFNHMNRYGPDIHTTKH
jgi:hypothetical protein